MLAYASTVIQNVITMFLLVFFGFFLYKKKLIDDHTSDQLSNIIMKFVSPALIISSYQRDFDKETAGLLWQSFLFSGLAILITIIYANVFYGKSKDHWQEKNLGVIFTNCSFMAFPLLEVLFGDIGIFMGSAYFSITSVLVWVYGLKVLLGDSYKLNFKKLLLNPGLIGLVIGMVSFFSPLKLPVILGRTLSLVGGLNTPLAMMLLGIYLARINIWEIFKDIKMLTYSIGTMLIMPAIIMLVFLLLPFGGSVPMTVVMVGAACPTGVTMSMMSSIYGKDPGYISKIVSITTIFSIVTLPIILTAFQYFITI